MDDLDLADTVAAFYDGAASPELWSAAGEKLRRLLDARVSVLRVSPLHSGFGEFVFYDGIVPSASQQGQYSEYYHAIDPHLALARAPVTTDERFVMLSQELVPERGYRHSEFYADFARGIDLGHMLGTRRQLSDGALAAMGLYRPMDATPFNETERRMVSALAPHLWRALELRQRLRPRLEAMAGLGALDALPQAVIIVDASSRVTFANAAAGRLADTADGGLRFVRPGPAYQAGLFLSAACRDDAAALARMVASVAGRGEQGGTLPLRRAENRHALPLAVLVCPLPAWLPTAGARSGLFPGLALVIATDLSRSEIPRAAKLCEIFGLSAGEAAVALALAGGRTAEEVAQMRGVGLGTIRTQVRAILGKTGAANLRDLERVLTSLPSAAPAGQGRL